MEVSVQDTLKKAITTRYKVYTKDEVHTIGANRKANVIIGDSLVASTLVDDTIELPSNTEFISPNLASMCNGQAVPFGYLLSLLDIDLEELKKDLEALKAANLNLVIVGYGGYSINTIEFLYQFCMQLGVQGLFKYLAIFEDDNLTFTNCLRIYPNLSTPAAVQNTVTKFEVFSEKYDGILVDKEDAINLVYSRLDEETFNEYYKDKNVTLLGAPDFATRALLEGSRFIFGGHSGDEVALINSPVVNAQLTTESYGTINPTTLFLNLIKGASMLPKALLNKEPDNTVLFEYNCTKALSPETPVDFLMNIKTEPKTTGDSHE